MIGVIGSWVRWPLAIVFLLLFTGVMSIVASVLSLFTKDWETHSKVILFWAQTILRVSGVKLDVKAPKDLPDTGVLFVFNHASLMDIPVLHSAIPRDFRFGAKVELFKIPLFGLAMKRMGYLPIPRKNRTQALKVYEGARELMQNKKRSFILAPEGTRQSNGEIAPFKSGPFILAIQAGVPIVPVVIEGLNEVLPKKTALLNVGAWHRTVSVRVLEPIPAAGLTFDDREQLKHRVRSAMVESRLRLQETRSSLRRRSETPEVRATQGPSEV